MAQIMFVDEIMCIHVQCHRTTFRK